MVGTDNTVTGNDDGKSVSPVGIGHGTYGRGRTNCDGKFLIRDCLPIGYIEQSLPHRFLEIGTYKLQRKVKSGASSGKIVVELAGSLVGYFGGTRPALHSIESTKSSHNPAGVALQHPVAQAQLAATGTQQQTTAGSLIGLYPYLVSYCHLYPRL